MYKYDKLLEYRKQDSETKSTESYIRSLLETSHIGDKSRLVVLSCFKDREDTITVEVSGGQITMVNGKNIYMHCHYLLIIDTFIRICLFISFSSFP